MRIIASVAKTAYPELARFLKSAIQADKFRSLRYPETWVWWGGLVVAFYVDFVKGQLGLALICLLATIILSAAARMIRYRTASLSQMVGILIAEAAPKNSFRRLQRGTLDFYLDEYTVSLLNRCAFSVNRLVSAYTESRFSGIKQSKATQKLQEEIVKISDAALRNALVVASKKVVFRRARLSQEEDFLNLAEADLAEVLGQAKYLFPRDLPAGESDLSKQLARLQKLREDARDAPLEA